MAQLCLGIYPSSRGLIFCNKTLFSELALIIIILNGTETSYLGHMVFIYCEKKPKNNNAALKLEKHKGYCLWTQTSAHANFRNVYTAFPLPSLSPAIWLWLSSEHIYNGNAMLMADGFSLRWKLSSLCFDCLWEYHSSNLKIRTVTFYWSLEWGLVW